MNSKERMRCAMGLGIPDRVPVMCQLAIGHYFLHAGLDPITIWYTSEGFAEALIRLCQRYAFDGILINLPGRDPDYTKHLRKIENRNEARVLHWRNGCHTIMPNDDLPHYFGADGKKYCCDFQKLNPEHLYYIEPWDITECTCPFTWGFEPEMRPFDDFFPTHHCDTIKAVRAKAGNRYSIHAEIFSPWSQFMELLNYEQALIAILDDPVKVKACLARLTAGAIDLGSRQAACGVDAILISSAFAGGGLLSRQHYVEFILPYEREVIDGIRARYDVPIYTHTCGTIGDRLDLMLQTGTDGIDTLDPPPLGNVELRDAKQFLQGKAFIKGNIDPVNTMLRGTRKTVRQDVKQRLAIGSPGGGYILSTACSVSPHTPPENIELLAEMAAEPGSYGGARSDD